jgi:ERF superfamily
MSEEPFDRQTGELMPITTSPTSSRGYLSPIAALPSSAETSAVWGAMIEAQTRLSQPRRTKKATIIPRDGRPGYSYKYAPIEEIARVLAPALAKSCLWYQQGLIYRGQQPFIRTMVIHKSGQWTASDYPVFADADARRFAGAVTMACRRGLMLMFGLTPEDDNEEIHEETPAKIREPRTQPRHASAFSKSHAPDEIDGKASAEASWSDLIGEGWMAADRGSEALAAFCARLTASQKREIGKPTYFQWQALALKKDGVQPQQDPPAEPQNAE